MDDRERKRAASPVEEELALNALRRAGPRQPVPPERAARVHAAVRAHWELRLGRRRALRLWVVMPLAAAAVLVVAVLLSQRGRPVAVGAVELVRGRVTVLAGGVGSAAAPGMELAAGATVATDGTSRAALRLAGGTSARLDRATRLTLVSAERLDLSAGTVYLDSGGGRGGVVVACRGVTARDVGTQLEVRLDGAEIRLRVREGEVELRCGAGTSRVGAGREARVAADGSLAGAAIAAADEAWGWVLDVAPPFALEGQTAAAFLHWVGRETGREVRWTSPAAAALAEATVLHGDLADVQPDQAPAVVLPTCGLAARAGAGVLEVGTMGP
jgi:ferric-dicitrate binding protein FerR (iron transport regulator)